MADAVRLFWLDGGSLPIFPFTGWLHYLAGGWENQEHTPLRWMPAAFNRQSGNAIIPCIDTTLEKFLAFMQEPNVVEGETLYVAIRTFARLESGTVLGEDGLPVKEFINTLLLAVAIVPGQIEGATPHNWRFEPLTTLHQLCTLVEREDEPDEPLLKESWLKLVASREQHRQHCLVQERAKRLLEAHLDEEQLAEFKKKHRFRVKGPDQLVYLITYESHGNVWLVETAASGKLIPRTNYCIVPTEDVPIYDQMLAQKFLIEHDLEAFKATANVAHFDDDGNRIREESAAPDAVAVEPPHDELDDLPVAHPVDAEL